MCVSCFCASQVMLSYILVQSLLLSWYVGLQNAEDANAKNYEDVAGGIDDLPFGIVFDSAVAEAVEVPINTVTIFKQVSLAFRCILYFANFLAFIFD